MNERILIEIYERLFSVYRGQGWWPVTPDGKVEPEYKGGPENPSHRFEVAVGAILTQNTAWKNASKAIENLNRAGLMSPDAIRAVDMSELAAAIRPAGYYNQKAERLKRLAAHLSEEPRPTRESLLSLNGIGPETADSIMLYAYGEPYFVVDAYTRRIFSRIGLIEGVEPYDEIRLMFERELPRNSLLYQEYHALIVEHAKSRCLRRKPICSECAITRYCDFDKDRG